MRGPSALSRTGRGHPWSCNGIQTTLSTGQRDTRNSSCPPDIPKLAASTQSRKIIPSPGKPSGAPREAQNLLSCRRREQPRVSPPSSAVYSPCGNESSVWEVHAAQTVGHGGKGHWRPKLQGPDPQEPVEKGRRHDVVPAAKMKPLGSPEDTQTGGGVASHGSAPERTVPCRASDMLRVAQHPGEHGPQLKVTGP